MGADSTIRILHRRQRPSSTGEARQRVAVFCESDYTWNFPLWKDALRALSERYDIVGICLFPTRTGPLKGARAIAWYLRTFGLKGFFLFSLFGVRRQIGRLTDRISSWSALGRALDIEIVQADSPNDDSVLAWTRSHEIDVGIISLDYILGQPIIDAVRVGIINKHSSILPSCRGLFPFLWSTVEGQPSGYTLHVVERGIDTGPILLQRRLRPEPNPSLLRFYIDVFSMFPDEIPAAIERMLRRQYQPPATDVRPSYHGLPDRAAVRAFCENGTVARWSDLFHRPARVPAEPEASVESGDPVEQLKEVV